MADTKLVRSWLTLAPLARLDDVALLAMRLATGAFIIDGVLDNVADPARMREFVEFQRSFGFSPPEFWAPFSVYTQLLAGLLLVPGLLTRWAGAILFVTFVVATVFVHWNQTLREWWPALALVVIGLLFMTRGAGRLSLDTLWERRPAG